MRACCCEGRGEFARALFAELGDGESEFVVGGLHCLVGAHEQNVGASAQGLESARGARARSLAATEEQHEGGDDDRDDDDDDRAASEK